MQPSDFPRPPSLSRLRRLIALAFFLAKGFVKTGLGTRIAYIIVSKFGSTTLGLTYSLVFAEVTPAHRPNWISFLFLPRVPLLCSLERLPLSRASPLLSFSGGAPCNAGPHGAHDPVACGPVGRHLLPACQGTSACCIGGDSPLFASSTELLNARSCPRPNLSCSPCALRAAPSPRTRPSPSSAPTS